MESAKEKAIREAWAEHYDFVKVNIGKDGSFFVYNYQKTLMEWCLKNAKCIEHSMNSGAIFIPYSIIGIENNNGWNLTSEKLPDEDKVYVFIRVGGKQVERYFSFGKLNPSTWRTAYTHWREKHEYPNPIY